MTSPTAPAPGASRTRAVRPRPAHAAYVKHLAVCEEAGRGLWCCVCSALIAAADLEDYDR